MSLYDPIARDGASALPLFNYANTAQNALKDALPTKRAYLGYRVLTYSLLPIIANVVSAVISGILCILTLPFIFCNGRFTNWCHNRFIGSVYYLKINLTVDLPYDVVNHLGCRKSPEPLTLIT